MAEKKLDLPAPLRPTTMLQPGLNGSTTTWSRYDLKPLMVSYIMGGGGKCVSIERMYGYLLNVHVVVKHNELAGK